MSPQVNMGYSPNYFPYSSSLQEFSSHPAGLFSAADRGSFSANFENPMLLGSSPQHDSLDNTSRRLLSNIDENEPNHDGNGELRLEDLMPSHRQSMRSFWDASN